MAQLNVYMPDILAKSVRKEARARGKNLSAFLSDLLRKHLGQRGGWREGFFTHVVGGWAGEFPEIERQTPEDREFE